MSNYFILCSNKVRHSVSTEEPLSRNEKCKCFSSCNKKDSCPFAAGGEFTILTAAASSVMPNAIKLNKIDNVWYELGKGPSSSASQNNNQASGRPVFNFQPNTAPVDNKPQETPSNAAPERPAFNFTPAPQPAEEAKPAPAPAPQPERPVFNFAPSNNQPAQENKPQEPVQDKPVFSFQPQSGGEQAPSGNSIFPTRDAAPAQPAQNSAPIFPSRDSSSSVDPNSSKVQSFKDRFKAQFSTQPSKPSILQGVTVNEMSQIVLGGKIYTNDYSLQRTRGALPLSRLIDEIRGHWQVPFVFQDEHKLSRNFIWLLLMLKILPNKSMEDRIEELLSATISDNPNTDKNMKFFYLMDIITPSNMKNGFYMSETYTYTRLTPLFTDVTDYVNKFFQDGQVGLEFRAISQRHLPEVMYFLGYTDKWPTKENKDEFRKELLQKQESLFDDFVIRHFENTKHLVYLNKQGETFFVEDLGSYENFVQCMAFPQKLATSRAMIEFLKRLRFTSSGNLLPRDSDNPLKESKKPDFEGSRVYEILGLTSSSYYLEEYNLYLTLLQEYISTFEPQEISINGVIYLSKLGFISEVRSILLEACEAALSPDLPDRDIYISKALLLYSLISRGVLNRYIAGNQSQQQYNAFLNIFAHLADNSLSVQEYAKAFGKDALFYFGGASVSQHDYLLNSIGSWQLNEIIERVNTNNILSTYITHDREKEKSIDSRVEAFDKAYAQFTKI